MVRRLVYREGLRETDDESALLLKLVDGDTWRQVLALSRRDPEGSVARAKGLLEARITRLFAERGARLEQHPLLPAMGTLLAAAAGDADAREQTSKETLDLFVRKLAVLLAGRLHPGGHRAAADPGHASAGAGRGGGAGVPRQDAAAAHGREQLRGVPGGGERLDHRRPLRAAR
ncbi:hypothetical protein GCM10023238_36240 [Streptomyces heliomycini]